MAVARTSVDVDRDVARPAAAILGTRTLGQVVDAKQRLELISILSWEGRFDFDAAEQAWGAER